MGGGCIAVAIHEWSEDCQSNSSVRGYSDIGGGGGGVGGLSMDGSGIVRVIPVYGDTLTYGGGVGLAVDIHG